MKKYKLTEGSSTVLDLVRAICAQMVVVGHGMSYFGIFTMAQPPNFPWIQNFAVLMFFLLSGFLIPYSLVRNRIVNDKYSFKHFFADRFSRIYAALIPSMIFILIIDLISKYLNPNLYLFTNALNFKTFAGNLLMLQDYTTFNFSLKSSIPSFGSGRVLWTLAIEWWLYMFFGYFLLVIIKKKYLSIFNLLVIFLFSPVPIYHLVTGRGTGLSTYWLYGTIIYLISTLSILKVVNLKLKLFLILFVFGLAFYQGMTSMNAYNPFVAFLLAIGLWLIIEAFKTIQINQKVIQLIKFSASYSFTLYLIHYSILDFIKIHFDQSASPFNLFLISFVVANIISALVGRFTEIVLTKKMKAFFRSKI